MIKDIIYRLIVGSLIFLFLLVIDSFIIDRLVRPKLSKLEVLYPRNGAEVANVITDVKVFIRAVEDRSIYIIVETPQGTMWTQEKLFTNKFKDELPGKARLGEEEVGIGKTFKIFVIATKEDLPIRKLDKVPSDAIYSNIVTVRRS